MKLQAKTLIDAPPDQVFRIATDVEHWHDAVPAITGILMLTPGPVRVGTKFRETRIMFGREATEEMTVAELEPPRRFVLTATSHGSAYLAVHEFEADGDGTRLALTFEARPISLVAWMLTPLGWLMSGSLRTTLASDLAALKTACERERNA